MRKALLVASDIVERETERRGLTPRLRSVVDLLKEGLSLADIYQISPDERAAVLLLACRHLQAGDHKTAKPLLTQLAILEPTDSRVLYALAVAHQSSGDPVLAGKLYLHVVALDATNPEAYLRLGECFLAERDIEAARGCFEGGKILAKGGHGTAEQVAHADKMLASLPTPSDAAA